MYRHLLVPIDNTDLSIEVVGNAVGLARAVGAHITFIHTVDREAGALRSASPDEPPQAFAGKATELLAKAEAAARAFGVPCDSKHAVGDRRAAAIIDAAREVGCDLVFMASHRHHGRDTGTRPTSQTISAVLDAGLPVLARIGDPAPPAHAIGIIRDEHRSLAAVLHAWMHLLATARSTGTAADPASMRAIVRYLQIFPTALHDPKEEDHLFKRLQARTSTVNAELDELERLHSRDLERVADLARRVDTLAAASGEAAVTATRDLDDAVRSYAAFVWDHLGREEGVILPAAQRHLTEADWTAIDAAFMKNRDPGAGDKAALEARQLFSRIVGTAHGP